MYDSDYNVAFDATLQELENDPSRIYQIYLDTDATEETARAFQAAFATADDNFRYKKTRAYREEKHYIESAALYLIWIIPAFLILLAIGLRISSSRSASG